MIQNPIQSVDGGYDQSKNWKVGRSDLSKTERLDLPVFERSAAPSESTQNLTQLPTAITREG